MSKSTQADLGIALNNASPVPDMPMTRIHDAAMAAFPARKPLMGIWTARFGALAATIVLGVGGFMALQTYQSNQQALTADADAFAEQLLSESF
jgi:hypothetical protein